VHFNYFPYYYWIPISTRQHLTLSGLSQAYPRPISGLSQAHLRPISGLAPSMRNGPTRQESAGGQAWGRERGLWSRVQLCDWFHHKHIYRVSNTYYLMHNRSEHCTARNCVWIIHVPWASNNILISRGSSYCVIWLYLFIASIWTIIGLSIGLTIQ
jgi:hypothetical protein